MSEQTRDHFDAELRSFLEWQADDVDGAPSVEEAISTISARVGLQRQGPNLGVLVLLAALALLLSSLAMGAILGSRHAEEPETRRFGSVEDGYRFNLPDGWHEGQAAELRYLPGRLPEIHDFSTLQHSSDTIRIAYGDANGNVPICTHFGGVTGVTVDCTYHVAMSLSQLRHQLDEEGPLFVDVWSVTRARLGGEPALVVHAGSGLMSSGSFYYVLALHGSRPLVVRMHLGDGTYQQGDDHADRALVNVFLDSFLFT